MVAEFPTLPILSLNDEAVFLGNVLSHFLVVVMSPREGSEVWVALKIVTAVANHWWRLT
jgi:hypothetical protein